MNSTNLSSPASQILSQLNQWRHLSAYGLERRLDPYFAFFMKDIIKYKEEKIEEEKAKNSNASDEEKLPNNKILYKLIEIYLNEKYDFKIHDNSLLIPEFPLNKDSYEKTIKKLEASKEMEIIKKIEGFFSSKSNSTAKENTTYDTTSAKLDFLLYLNSKSYYMNSKSYYIEVKTDNSSLSKEQIKYTAVSKNVGLKEYISKMIFVWLKSYSDNKNEKAKKYFSLMQKIKDSQILNFPDNLGKILYRDRSKSMSEFKENLDSIYDIYDGTICNTSKINIPDDIIEKSVFIIPKKEEEQIKIENHLIDNSSENRYPVLFIDFKDIQNFLNFELHLFYEYFKKDKGSIRETLEGINQSVTLNNNSKEESCLKLETSKIKIDNKLCSEEMKKDLELLIKKMKLETSKIKIDNKLCSEEMKKELELLIKKRKLEAFKTEIDKKPCSVEIIEQWKLLIEKLIYFYRLDKKINSNIKKRLTEKYEDYVKQECQKFNEKNYDEILNNIKKIAPLQKVIDAIKKEHPEFQVDKRVEELTKEETKLKTEPILREKCEQLFAFNSCDEECIKCTMLDQKLKSGELKIKTVQKNINSIFNNNTPSPNEEGAYESKENKICINDLINTFDYHNESTMEFMIQFYLHLGLMHSSPEDKRPRGNVLIRNALFLFVQRKKIENSRSKLSYVSNFVQLQFKNTKADIKNHIKRNNQEDNQECIIIEENEKKEFERDCDKEKIDFNDFITMVRTVFAKSIN